MTIYQSFKPTYLYIKQHNITGLLYLGVTTLPYKQMLTYSGSGRFWQNHIKVHGRKFISNIWFCLFYTEESLTEFALLCSKQWDIVDAKNESGEKIWANLINESGLGVIKYTAKRGEIHGNFGKRRTIEQRNLLSERSFTKGKTYKELDIPHPASGHKHTEESLQLMRSSKQGEDHPMFGKHHSEEALQKISARFKGKKQRIVCCPNCGKLGGASVMKRYHFDNCKSLLDLAETHTIQR